ncbi:MAG: hypothetical protein D6684_04900 [Deinococcus-Thermus bacterium]|nr:MAG: hypothetical protein D6684_04900 [Deinococcota bacterium]
MEAGKLGRAVPWANRAWPRGWVAAEGGWAATGEEGVVGRVPGRLGLGSGVAGWRTCTRVVWVGMG